MMVEGSENGHFSFLCLTLVSLGNAGPLPFDFPLPLVGAVSP